MTLTVLERPSPARFDAIVRLLQTRDDYLPQPVVRTSAPRGPVHQISDNVETCPDCLANYDAPPSWRRSCPTCHGSGLVRAPRRVDPYVEDDKVLPYGWDSSRHEIARSRDRQIAALEQQLAPPRSESDLVEEANRHPYGWENERKRMYTAFDYGPLDAALEKLRAADERGYRLLHAVYVYGWLTELSAGAEQACEDAIRFLSHWLPGGWLWKAAHLTDERERDRELRAPKPHEPVVNVVAKGRESDRRALDQRDDAIVAAIDAKVPTEEVAKRFDLGVRQVNRIYANVKLRQHAESGK